MSDDGTVIQRSLETIAFLFGSIGDPEEAKFKIEAYQRLITKFPPGSTIDEFDLINELEEIDSFFSIEDMRRLVNELKILNRSGDGKITLREEVFFDELAPGSYLSQEDKFSTSFLTDLQPTQTSFDASQKRVTETVAKSVLCIKRILEAADESPIDFVTPFYQHALTSDGINFSYAATAPASTPFLDIFLSWSELGSLGNELINADDHNHFVATASKFLKNYIERIEQFADPSEPYFAFFLVDDEDLPGSQRPTTVANGSLLSTLVSASRSGSFDGVLGELIEEAIPKLADFILRQQNDTGGWSTFRYETEKGELQPIATSHNLVSLICFAALLDASDVVSDEGLQNRIQRSAKLYAAWLIKQFNRLDDQQFALENSDRKKCVYETAIGALSCHLAAILAPQSKKLLAISKGCVSFIASNWQAGKDARTNQHNISLRAPERDKLALLPIEWISPGDSRIVRVLSVLAARRNIWPPFETMLEIAKSVSAICDECEDGFARRLVDESLAEVSTTKHHLSALIGFLSIHQAWNDR